MGLTDDERLQVAVELLASVDGPPDGNWQTAWLEELERRRTASERRGERATAWHEARDRILVAIAHAKRAPGDWVERSR